ncbi:MAG: hypothetical protein V1870_05760 [Candidatus Aenigmatarchaeota archaeon]
MVSMTLSIPEDLRERMSEHPEIKWSDVVRAILEQQIREIEEAERISSKSRLTEKDVHELVSSVDKQIAKRWKNASRS